MTGPALREQQDALLRALWAGTHEDAARSLTPGELVMQGAWERGLVAYRSNGHQLAQRALAAAYPVVAELLGEENFRALARAFWQGEPPAGGDIAQWGEGLASHIEALPDLNEAEPYVADVARVEWLLHACATAPDGAADNASFQLLAQCDPEALTLVLSPGAACFASGYPVVSIVNAHVEQVPTLEVAGQRLRGGTAETALVWREGLRPRLREAWPGEAAFVTALLAGHSLASALDAGAAFDFRQWLVPAIQSGLLLAAAPL